MEVLIEDILRVIDNEVSSTELSILSVNFPLENTQAQRVVRDKLIWLKGKVLKIYEKHCDIERGFKWQ